MNDPSESPKTTLFVILRAIRSRATQSVGLWIFAHAVARTPVFVTTPVETGSGMSAVFQHPESIGKSPGLTNRPKRAPGSPDPTSPRFNSPPPPGPVSRITHTSSSTLDGRTEPTSAVIPRPCQTRLSLRGALSESPLSRIQSHLRLPIDKPRPCAARAVGFTSGPVGDLLNVRTITRYPGL
jgi:hypothetical protein